MDVCVVCTYVFHCCRIGLCEDRKVTEAIPCIHCAVAFYS